MKILFFTILFLSVSLYAENIHLKNGSTITNVKIMQTDDKGFVHYQLSDGRSLKVHSDAILKIDDIPFNESKASEITSGEINKIFHARDPQLIDAKNEPKYPNMILLPVSLIAFALTYDSFMAASDLSKSIDEYKDIPEVDTGDLESQRTRKIIVGSVYLIAGIFNTFICFRTIEVSAKNNSLTLSYKF